jgi:MerR family transcriptional regulator, light-induced transcriptional regulator
LDESFTPKQVATALQVSESSVKRWCDRGVIRTDRTLGGHRRIPLQYLLEFLENTNRRVADPSAIGMSTDSEMAPTVNVPALGHANRASSKKADEETQNAAVREKFEKALIAGNEDECRRIVSVWYAMNGGIASVADDLLSPTFRSIGDKWTCGDLEVYQERRGCDICFRIIHELRRLLPDPQGFSPLAMGGTSVGDQYQLPTQMIEMLFREFGWRTIGLGCNIPFPSLLSAARKHMPKVFWLSVSHIDDRESFLTEYQSFANHLPKGVMLVVGGRALTDELRSKMTFAAHCDKLMQLSQLARTVRAGARPPGNQI